MKWENPFDQYTVLMHKRELLMQEHLKNKYYTPEIEEFHPGFIFESRYGGLNGSVSNKDWKEHTFDINELEIRDVELAIDINMVRVKHLDRDCIEELGWQHDYNMEPIPNREVNPVFEGYLFEKNGGVDQWCLYHFNDHQVWMEHIHNCGGQGYVFQGFIKNKSELKRLMQWLGIS